MPNNNPGGANGTQMFDGFNEETPYGAVKRLTQLTQQSPVAQQSRPKKAGQARPEQQAQLPPPQVDPQMTPTAVWAEAALIPGISPLVQEWAAGA